MPAPEIWISLRACVDLSDFMDENAAEIMSGHKTVYDITVIEPRTAENQDDVTQWSPIAAGGLYIGRPGCEGVYPNPGRVPDPDLRYYAMDMWASTFGFEAGDIVRYAGMTYTVMAQLLVDVDGDEYGFHSGWLICQCMSTRLNLACIRVEAVRRVGVLTP